MQQSVSLRYEPSSTEAVYFVESHLRCAQQTFWKALRVEQHTFCIPSLTPDLGSGFLVLVSGFWFFGSWFLVLGAWFLVLGS